jgi:hypothetical protein
VFEAGTKFNSLTTTGEIISTGQGRKVVCRCVCGKIVMPYAAELRGGRAKSCGCMRALKEKPCSHCKKLFMPKRGSTKTCSKKCQGDSQRVGLNEPRGTLPGGYPVSAVVRQFPDGLPHEDVGMLLGLSWTRVHQIETEALRKLRDMGKLQELFPNGVRT